MKRLLLSSFLAIIDAFIIGREPFSSVRDFVFRYFEAEDDIELDDKLGEVFSVLAPYLEYEEAYGDEKRRDRLLRLRQVLAQPEAAAERTVFALEFDRIKNLHKKFAAGLIARRVYDDQLRQLSPCAFDVRRVALWAAAHEGIGEVSVDRMS